MSSMTHPMPTARRTVPPARARRNVGGGVGGVNGATRTPVDAYEARFNKGLLASVDGALAPPVRHVVNRLLERRAIVAQPPRRNSVQLAKPAAVTFIRGEANLRQSQLPKTGATSGHHVLPHPEHWK